VHKTSAKSSLNLEVLGKYKRALKTGHRTLDKKKGRKTFVTFFFLT